VVAAAAAASCHHSSQFVPELAVSAAVTFR
jgi:hypothetical protein